MSIEGLPPACLTVYTKSGFISRGTFGQHDKSQGIQTNLACLLLAAFQHSGACSML